MRFFRPALLTLALTGLVTPALAADTTTFNVKVIITKAASAARARRAAVCRVGKLLRRRRAPLVCLKDHPPEEGDGVRLPCRGI